MTTSPVEERSAALETLGKDLAGLRLSRADDLAAMRASLDRHGQLTPLVVFAEPPQWVIVDGFKRLHAARALGWKKLGVRVLSVLTRAHAKASVLVLNDQRGLSELEEAWLCRALYREDHLRQPAIAQLLGRHKSWVCRRLMLAESLEDTVVADVRLGLLKGAEEGVTLAAGSCCNSCRNSTTRAMDPALRERAEFHHRTADLAKRE